VSAQRVCGVALALVLAGCGLNVQSPDLFLLTRTGAGGRLTLLVNDGGTIRCDGRAAKPLPDKLLLQARDLATRLNDDAKRGLRIPPTPNSVATYIVKLQHGVVSFPDTAARAHSELSQLELFAVRAAQGPCRLSGQPPGLASR
jgi:hypothetical protein